MAVLIDFHSHILPCIDDGSNSCRESLLMLQEEKRQGVETVVATPHFYPHNDRPERFAARRQKALEELRKHTEGINDLPLIVPAAEVYYFNGIGSWQGLEELCIEGTNHILVEMPFCRWSEKMYLELEAIRKNLGLVPIVAHIERYINIFTAKRVLGELKATGAVIQANGELFCDSKRQALALKMLKNGDINILGSDCHNMHNRAPNLEKAEKIILSKLGQGAIDGINLTGKNILAEHINI